MSAEETPYVTYLYGERPVSTTGRHGNNVSSQRIDELDTACLDFIRRRRAG